VGTLISFSTQPGNVALDGAGRNSPFAKALVKQLGTSNDDLSAILIAVRNDVMSETQRKQVPWEHSALTGRFYFSAAAATAVATAPAPARLNEATPSPSRTPPFDGIWTMKIVCSQMTDGTRGYAQEFVAEVKGGVLHGENGIKDKPGWRTFDGKIQPDGSAWIKERGLNAERVGQAPPGTPYAFDMLAQLDATRGTGKRVSGRQCDFTFAKK
jgi:hypothetical protein